MYMYSMPIFESVTVIRAGFINIIIVQLFQRPVSILLLCVHVHVAINFVESCFQTFFISSFLNHLSALTIAFAVLQFMCVHVCKNFG